MPDANGHVPPGTCGAIWNYDPSFAAAVVFAAVFLGMTGGHGWLAVRYKAGWCWVIILASLWETLAFTFRAISSKFQQSDGVYLVFQIFILLAPLWINAFIYLTLARMINTFLPTRSLLGLPAPTFGALFVTLDIMSFIIQLVGGSMASPTSSAEDQQKALNIYMGGMGLQQVFIVVFVWMCVTFQRERARLPPSLPQTKAKVGVKWRPVLYTLYLSLTLITIRIIYRFIEFSDGGLGLDNPLTMNEAYFYVLEAVPMVLAVGAFVVVHPGGIVGGYMPGFFATVRERFQGRRSGMTRIDDEDQGADKQGLVSVDGFR